MIYPESFEAKTGFDIVRRRVRALCVSTLGHTRCADMRFLTDYGAITRALSQVDEMLKIITGGDDFPLHGIHDTTEALRSIKVPGAHIAADELLRLRNTMETMSAITAFFRRNRDEQGVSIYPTLDELAAPMPEMQQHVRAIDRVIDRFGQVKDNASPELARIRSALSSMAGAINTAMRRVITRAVKDGLLDADATSSLRDGRPVIPVSPMNKRKIPGIVHDESASGKTYFIEPAEVVETSNRMRELQIDERREVLRILTELSDYLRPALPDIFRSFDILADFDFIYAKARYAIESGGMMPHIHPQMELEWYHACHPVLKASLESQSKEIVPLSITLNTSTRILVISGPNAGGKSVTLKTVAIVQYMMQCGLLPPVYENSHMGIIRDIFIDIGDDQSIEDDLSTYSSHLRNMKYFLSHGNKHTLVLIDEFGSGTEPQIGGAIAQAVLRQFVEAGIWGVVTTHFQNLKHFAEETDGLVNGCMLYDRQLMQPLFRLSIGNAGSSFAIEIARKTGLPESIIHEAEQIVGSEYINLDKYLLDIARDKRYWENKRASIRQKEKKIDALIERYDSEADTLHAERRRIIDQAKAQAQEILDKSNAAIERTIHDIKVANAEKERTIEARRRLAAEKEEIANTDLERNKLLNRRNRKNRDKGKNAKTGTPTVAPPTIFSVGDHVLLDGAGTVGKIMEIQGNNALVAFGILKTQVKTDRLSHTDRKPKNAAGASRVISAAVSDASRERQLNFHPEIDVRGMRVDEALQAVTYFIDDAVQFSAGRVRILHGTGTGALRQAIRQYLSGLSSVSTYADEDVRFGGAGITVVELV